MTVWLMMPTARCSYAAFRDTPLTEYDAPPGNPANADKTRVDEGKDFAGSWAHSVKLCYERAPLLGQEPWKGDLLLGFAFVTVLGWASPGCRGGRSIRNPASASWSQDDATCYHDHRRPQRSARGAANARSRSPCCSRSDSSMPTERPDEADRRCRASCAWRHGDARRGVMIAGCSISDSTPPSDSARCEHPTRLDSEAGATRRGAPRASRAGQASRSRRMHASPAIRGLVGERGRGLDPGVEMTFAAVAGVRLEPRGGVGSRRARREFHQHVRGPSSGSAPRTTRRTGPSTVITGAEPRSANTTRRPRAAASDRDRASDDVERPR